MARKRQSSDRQSRNKTPFTDKRRDSWESFFQSLSRLEIALFVGAVLLLLVLIYTVQSIISPFVVLGAMLFLLYPLRRYAMAKSIMWLSVLLFSLWFVYEISSILAPFVVSLLFAYLLNPVVTRLHVWRIPRWLSSLVLILFFVGLLVLLLFFVFPIAVTQFEGMVNALSDVFEGFRTWLWSSRMTTILERYGVSAEELRNTLSQQLAPRFEDIVRNFLQGILLFVTSISKVVTRVFYIILIPFLTFYLLTDFEKINHRFRMLFPHRRREQVAIYMQRADEVIGRYLRGALFIALLQGIAVTLTFSLFGIKYALLLGIVAGLLDLVPYIGLIITMILSAIVALFSEEPILEKVVLAVSTVGILHLIEVTLLAPKIVGKKVGMHPLLIILSLLVFSFFLGFVGLLIAVPTTALIILFVREWEAARKGVSSSMYHTIESEW
ncbi:MAG: AI-2E family transporter [Ignavibacteria bacterium]|nr:AI-2E family transporter [Ignavibacteria bacterium]